jgi:hypothetical protein
MTTRATLIGCMMAAVFVAPQPARAQPEPAPLPQADTLFFIHDGGPLLPLGGRVDVIRGEGALIGGIVKRKPYTADSVTETAQILADGNRITHRNESRIYRDSEGRTRREQTVKALGVWQTANETLTFITIDDPVAEVSYFLDPVSHTARQFKPQRLAFEAGATWTRVVRNAPAPDGAAGMAVFTHRLDEPGVGRGTEPPGTFELPVPPPQGGIAVQGAVQGVVTSGEPAFASATVAFGPFAAAPAAETRKEDLGEQVLEGVLTRGTRETQTIPAGAMGNERDIEIVADEWYSEDIEDVVLRRTFDPRFGETTYRLVNLVRGEPSPDLFVVPQGYEVLGEPEPREIDHGVEPGERGRHTDGRVFVVRPDPQKTGE